jgi:hypothetical protein
MKMDGQRGQNPILANADNRLLASLPALTARCESRRSARGKWLVRCGVRVEGRRNLDGATSFVVEGRYPRHEVDARRGLALLRMVGADVEGARHKARSALQLAGEVGYDWGKADGIDLLPNADEPGAGASSGEES